MPVKAERIAGHPTLAVYDYASQPKEDVLACPVCGVGNQPERRVDRYGYQIGLARCACGFGYLTPQMTPDAYAGFYEGWYRTILDHYYGREAKTMGEMEQGQWQYGKELAKACPQVIGGDVLDAGGSTGAVAAGWATVKTVLSVTVLDPSATELERAAARFYQTVQGTLEGMVWEGEPIYDVVLCAQTIDHVQDPVKALRHLREATVDGGWLVIDYVSCDPRLTLCGFVDLPQALLKIDHPCYWTEKSLRLALSRTGWTVESAKHTALNWLRTKGLLLCRTC